jgi:hypothetical protein
MYGTDQLAQLTRLVSRNSNDEGGVAGEQRTANSSADVSWAACDDDCLPA